MPRTASAFTIEHYDAPLLSKGIVMGANIMPNSSFETASFADWVAPASWHIYSGTTPPPVGNYAAQADAAGTPGVEKEGILQTARQAVTGNTPYYLSFAIGCNEESGAGDAQPNTLLVEARWFSALVAGTLLRTDTLWQAPLSGNDQTLKTITRRVTAPQTAAALVFYFENVHTQGATGTPTGTVLDDVAAVPEVTTSTSQLLELVRHETVSPRFGFENLVYSTNFQTGFKAVEFDLRGSAVDVMRWILDAVGHELVIRHLNGRAVWRGLVWKLQGLIGGTPFTVSHETIYTRFVVSYPGKSHTKQLSTYLGELGRRYGDRVYVEGEVQDSKNDARRRLKQLLKEYALPRFDDEFVSVANDQIVSLHVVGIGAFGTLDFVRGVRIPGASEMPLANALAKHPSSLLNTARARGNTFISNDYSFVEDVGQKVGGTNSDAVLNGSILDLALKYVGAGAGDGSMLVSGVWDENRFVLKKRPTTIAYFTNAARTEWRDAVGNWIEKAFVRAGEFYRPALAIPRANFGANAVSDAQARFITETKYDTENDRLETTTVGARGVDKRVARAMRWMARRSG